MYNTTALPYCHPRLIQSTRRPPLYRVVSGCCLHPATREQGPHGGPARKGHGHSVRVARYLVAVKEIPGVSMAKQRARISGRNGANDDYHLMIL